MQPNILTVTNVADCDTVEQLATRIVEFVQFATVQLSKPPKLGTINRRFGIRAAKLGTSARDIVMQLVDDGRLHSFVHFRATILLTDEFVKQQEEYIGNDPILLQTARDRMFARAE